MIRVDATGSQRAGDQGELAGKLCVGGIRSPRSDERDPIGSRTR